LELHGKQAQNYPVAISILLVIVILCSSILLSSATAHPNYITDKTLSPISEVNTRNKQIPFYPPAAVNFTLTKFGSGCPPEIAVYIHGYKRNDTEAKEEFNRIQTSLTHDNYRVSLVGLSWNSNVLWYTAKVIAEENGPLLQNISLVFTINVQVLIFE